MSRSEMAQWLRVPLTRAMFIDALCELTVAVGLAQQRHRMAVALASRRKKLQKVQTVLRALQVTNMMQTAAAERRKAEGATGSRLALDTATGVSDTGEVSGNDISDGGLPVGFINPFSDPDGSSPHHHSASARQPRRRSSAATSSDRKGKLKNAAFKVQVMARKNSFARQSQPHSSPKTAGHAHIAGESVAARAGASPKSQSKQAADRKDSQSSADAEDAAEAKREESLTVDQLIRSEASSLNMDAREVRLLAGMGEDAAGGQDAQQQELFEMLQLSPSDMSQAAAGLWTGQPAKPTILQSILASVNSKGAACVPSYSGARGPRLKITGTVDASQHSTGALRSESSDSATPWQALKTVSHAVELTTGLMGPGGAGGTRGPFTLGADKADQLQLPEALFRAAGMTMRLFVPEKLDHLVSNYVLPRAQQVNPQAGIRRELARRKPIGVLIHERRLLSGIFTEYATVPAMDLAECAVQRSVRSHQLPLLSRSGAPPPPVTGVASDDQTSAWVQSRELAIKAAQAAAEESLAGDTIGPRRRLVAGVVVRDEDGALTVDTSLPEWRLENRMSYLAFRQLFVDCGLYDPSNPSVTSTTGSTHSTRTPLVSNTGDMSILAERDIALAFLLATENTEASLGFSKLAQNAAVLNREQLRHAEQLISEEGAAALLPGHHLAPSIMQSDLHRLRRAGRSEGLESDAVAAAAVTWDLVAQSPPSGPEKADSQRRSRFRVSDGVWLRQFRERVVRSCASITLGQFMEALARVGIAAYRDTPNLDTHERIASLLDSIVAHKSWLVDRAHRVLLRYKETVASGRRSGRLRAANRRRNEAAAASGE